MSTPANDYTLAELMITAAAEAFRNEGEVLATGIGMLPRLAASVAMKTFNTDLMMTDSEAYLLSEPNPVTGRTSHVGQKSETWMGFSRIFDNVWSGKRHAMIGPTQIDRFGQANISALGGTYDQPKVMMLGVRGLPGNSISHGNSFFVPSHSKKVFVEGECDMVGSIGYNPDRLPKGYKLDDVKISIIVTDLCVMDFGGVNHAPRLVSLHPGITAEQVVENTGFELEIPADVSTTPAPTEEQMAIIQEMDPKNGRAYQIKGNPKGDRS
jgi:glutaconate CoA-transferase subunit B